LTKTVGLGEFELAMGDGRYGLIVMDLINGTNETKMLDGWMAGGFRCAV